MTTRFERYFPFWGACYQLNTKSLTITNHAESNGPPTFTGSDPAYSLVCCHLHQIVTSTSGPDEDRTRSTTLTGLRANHYTTEPKALREGVEPPYPIKGVHEVNSFAAYQLAYLRMII